jgi:hypothetical protein
MKERWLFVREIAAHLGVSHIALTSTVSPSKTPWSGC